MVKPVSSNCCGNQLDLLWKPLRFTILLLLLVLLFLLLLLLLLPHLRFQPHPPPPISTPSSYLYIGKLFEPLIDKLLPEPSQADTVKVSLGLPTAQGVVNPSLLPLTAPYTRMSSPTYVPLTSYPIFFPLKFHPLPTHSLTLVLPLYQPPLRTTRPLYDTSTKPDTSTKSDISSDLGLTEEYIDMWRKSDGERVQLQRVQHTQY